MVGGGMYVGRVCMAEFCRCVFDDDDDDVCCVCCVCVCLCVWRGFAGVCVMLCVCDVCV